MSTGTPPGAVAGAADRLAGADRVVGADRPAGAKRALRVVLAPPVATVVFDRPEKRNAFSLAMWEELAALLTSFDVDDGVAVVVLRSSSAEAFAAGADIAEFADQRSDPASGARYNEAVLQAERAIAGCQKPTVAVVQGYAIGGGCKIAMACDFRVGDVSADFRVPVAKLGIVYPPESIQRLVDVVGARVAKLLLIGGQRLVGEEAYRLGLLDFLWPAEELRARVPAFCDQLAKGSPHSVGATKAFFEHMLRHRVGEKAAALYRQVEHGSYELPEYRQNIATHRSGPSDGTAPAPADPAQDPTA